MNPDETKSLITKVLLVMLTSLSTSLHLSESASTLATMSSDIADAFVLGYGIYSHWDMKKVPETARVVGGMLLLALLCGLGSPVQAANLAGPTKAAPVAYSPDTGGFYLGASSFISTQSAQIGDTTLLSSAGSLGGVAGYGRGNGTSWWAIEGGAYWQNLGGSGTCTAGMPCALGSKFTGDVVVKFGGPVTNFLNLLPQLSSLFPGTTPSTVAANLYPYLGGVIEFNDMSASIGLANARAWEIPFGVRVGNITKLTNGTVMDTWAQVTFQGSGFAVGGADVDQGKKYKAGVSFMFGA